MSLRSSEPFAYCLTTFMEKRNRNPEFIVFLGVLTCSDGTGRICCRQIVCWNKILSSLREFCCAIVWPEICWSKIPRSVTWKPFQTNIHASNYRQRAMHPAWERDIEGPMRRNTTNKKKRSCSVCWISSVITSSTQCQIVTESLLSLDTWKVIFNAKIVPLN